MTRIDILHIDLNRVLLLAVGLWPYQQSKLVKVQLVFSCSILMTFIVFQFMTFAISQCTSDLFINVLSSGLFYVFLIIKYNMFWLNIKVVKDLLEQLQRICNELRDEKEISILKKYGSNAERFTTVLTLFAVFVVSALIVHLFWPRILDILLPINESRPHPSLLFITEYSFDQERYFYFIFIHALAALCIGGFAVLATGMFLLMLLHHACGMFRIASYRIEHAMTTITLKNSLKNSNLIYEELIYAVDIHREAIKFSEMSVSRFKVMFFLLIATGIICETLNVFRIFQMFMIGCDIGELLLPFVMLIIHLLYMSIGNYIAQQITDHNNHVFATIYNVRWYMTPLHVQKMILFLLQKNSKDFNLSISSVFVGSLQGAATLISTTISYITMLYSLHH